MVTFRRDYTPGGTYFFTLVLNNRKSQLLTSQINLLGEAFRKVKQKYPFCTEAIVVLPDHIHTVWKLPDNDFNYSLRWHQIKSNFTKSLIKEHVKIIKDQRGEYSLWQRRFWEHRIRDESDLQSHIDYIHFNPVKHGYVTSAKEWPYSSFHRYVQNGTLPENWGSDGAHGEFGE
ncbi:Transposase IS200 like protein [Legionella moravica]|uniref:Transposase IS200 like protein n=1 Tax=Legionella moravica TaxID=39962 RepID=A0A378JY99_9GAMM|nr:transposase [Legionella moravica]KTD35424.1 Transposase IS200 like protein [Legionella moravica]STX62009.1 Transposase and inactivated derivatives [Legionella moravica]